jgi:hypothetical protein
MKEEEEIVQCLLRVDEIVNIIKGLGDELDEKIVFQKVLISLPVRYDPKISTLEYQENLEKLTMY